MIEKGQRDSKVLAAEIKKGPKAREFGGPQKTGKSRKQILPRVSRKNQHH